ncbi:MAG: hypothetical protein M3Z04_03170 [Chloroflexota bacterium]|nr:hypothetical protein [Chloroflexota bacterium]
MQLAQELQILAGLLWFLLLVGPGILVATFANMMYVDGATRAPGAVEVHTRAAATLMTWFIAEAIWLVLLKVLYLPAIGFDNSFLSFSGASAFNYTDLYQLQVLWGLTWTWITHNPAQALLYIAFPVLALTAIGVIARVRGRAASIPHIPKSEWNP